MKKIIIIFLAGLLVFTTYAQVDKTKLSLDVSKQYKQNIALLGQHTWKRKVEGFVKGNLVMSSLSSVTISPDYKLTAVVIQQQSYVEKKRGIRGAIQKSTMQDVNEYVKNAIELLWKYIYLSDGQMVDLFNKGTLSLLDNNLQAEGFNLLTQGDHLNYKFDKTSLNYVSQDIATVMNGDPVKAVVVYQTINSLNRVSSIKMDLPGVGVNINLSNFEFAKKL
jgi:hypothetical protein